MNVEIKIPIKSRNGEENRLVVKYLTLQRETGATDDTVSLVMPDDSTATVAARDFERAVSALRSLT